MATTNQTKDDLHLIGTRIHKVHIKTLRLLAVEAGYATVAQWLRALIVREIEKAKESA